MENLLRLYRILARSSKAAYSIEQLKRLTHGFYHDDINEKSVNKKIRRDLKKLESILITGSLHTIIGKGNQPDQYYLSADASIEQLSSELALVLVIAKDYLRQYLPHQIYDKVNGFFASAEQQLAKNTSLDDWQSRIRYVPAGYSEENESSYDVEEIRNIYTALLDDEAWLKVLYRKEGQLEQTGYTLKPHGIIQHGHKQYLMASKIVDNTSSLRTFNMQRFDKVELIEQRITVDVDSYNLDLLVDEKEYEDAYFERDELDIKLRCEDYLLDELKNNPINFSQDIEETEDGYFTLTASCIITQSLLNWLIEKAHSIQVLAPKELFEKVQIHVFAANENYDMDFEDLEKYGTVEREIDLLEELYSIDDTRWDILEEEIDEPFDGLTTLPSSDLLDTNHCDEVNVRLFEFFGSSKYRDPDAMLNVVVGVVDVNIDDSPFIIDLAKARHLLIAGNTFSGKTTLIKAMLLSMLLEYSPKQLRLILINPEPMKLELADYQDIPHLLTPVITTNMQDAINALNWCENEMEHRFQLIASSKTRNIDHYNEKILEASDHESLLPRIVVIVDEFAHLMMQMAKKAEEKINRLTQKSSVVGIHLILATHNVSQEVITDVMKTNIPTRIAFRVKDNMESRLILDIEGAENLLEQGEILCRTSTEIGCKKIQGTFVSTEEIYRICKAWRKRGEPKYVEDVLLVCENEKLTNNLVMDALFEQSVDFILETQQVSISALKHKFDIGYNRAARIVDQMEEREIVSAMRVDSQREILVHHEQKIFVYGDKTNMLVSIIEDNKQLKNQSHKLKHINELPESLAKDNIVLIVVDCQETLDQIRVKANGLWVIIISESLFITAENHLHDALVYRRPSNESESVAIEKIFLGLIYFLIEKNSSLDLIDVKQGLTFNHGNYLKINKICPKEEFQQVIVSDQEKLTPALFICMSLNEHNLSRVREIVMIVTEKWDGKNYQGDCFWASLTVSENISESIYVIYTGVE